MNVTRGKIAKALKVVVYGPEGIGKSTFASKFPNPLFIDTEGSTAFMDVTRFDKPSSWTMLMEQVKYVKAHFGVCRTLIIDTADWAEMLCIKHVCDVAKKTGIEDFGYGKGYVYLEEEYARLLQLLQEIVDSGVHVVLAAHAQIQKFEQPDEVGQYDRWALKLEKKTMPLVKEWADILLFANYKTYVVNVDGQGASKGKNKVQGGQRVMYTTHHSAWDAKNRHDLPEELPFDFSAIAHLINSYSPTTASPTPAPAMPAPAVPAPSPAATVTEARAPAKEPEPETKEAEQVLNVPAPAIPADVPKALADLMASNAVTVDEIMTVVARKGYFPAGTQITNLPNDFIQGVLVAAWPQVFVAIESERAANGSLPFTM